jgi:hypothetical protein
MEPSIKWAKYREFLLVVTVLAKLHLFDLKDQPKIGGL